MKLIENTEVRLHYDKLQQLLDQAEQDNITEVTKE